MIFTTEVWFGLCKLITYQLVKLLTSFVPTQRGPNLVILIHNTLLGEITISST